MHPAGKAALAVAVLGLLVPTASGQALDPAVAVTVDEERILVPSGEARVVTWTVRNDGPIQATVALDLAVQGPWTTDFEERYTGPFTLQSAGVRTVSVRFSPATDTSQSLADQTAVLSAQATDGLGRTATGSAGVVLAYGSTALPPPPPPPDHTLRNALLGAGGVLLLAAGAYVATGRTVGIRCSTDTIHLGSIRGAWVRMTVVNRSSRRKDVQVRVRAQDAVATTDQDRLSVDGKGRETLTLFVRSAQDVGRVALDVRTRGHWWRQAIQLGVVNVTPGPSPFGAPPEGPPAVVPA